MVCYEHDSLLYSLLPEYTLQEYTSHGFSTHAHGMFDVQVVHDSIHQGIWCVVAVRWCTLLPGTESNIFSSGYGYITIVTGKRDMLVACMISWAGHRRSIFTWSEAEA